MLIPAPKETITTRQAAVGAMAAYLLVAPHVRLEAEIREELIALLDQRAIDKESAKFCVEAADPEVLSYLVARGVNLQTVGMPRQEMCHALTILELRNISPERRRALFAIMSPHISSPSGRVERRLAWVAIKTRDLAFFDMITAWATHLRPAGLVLHRTAEYLDVADAGNVGFWKELFSRVDPHDAEIGPFAVGALKYGHMRRIALLLAIGYSLSEAAEVAGVNMPSSPPAWLLRIHGYARSAHGQLELIKRRPSLEDVFTMKAPVLQACIAGLSNRQRRAILRKKRARKFPQSLLRLWQASGEAL